ncbi:MAG: PKD domain-containing protein, partial [Candidatus Cloacimonetes bacterium]|nr:PKD domain-containing protein [Candidatus Cloacimonadota bacterium]
EGANLYATDYTVIGDPNGILDPGETVELEVTLENLGAVAANGISGILSSPNNYIVIDDADGYFGNIAAGGQASNSSNRFMITANAQVIPGSQFTLELELNNAQGYNNTVSFPINVGTVSITDPVGPDAYGYYCYDDEDIDYFNVPTYDWIEINSIGTDLQLNDGGDTGDSETINLPITFRMYGEEYNTVTVCSNGWIAPGGSSQASFMNSRIPGPQGPSPMIAPFWDDLKNGSTGDVFWYYDNTQHYVVIEWDHMQNDYNGAEETFQAILYDANYYPTSTGDSEIKVQYKIINNVDAGGSLSEHGQYSSVGIEDHTGTVGLEYTFNNAYPVAAKSLQNQMALLFTGPPIPFEEPFLVLGGLIINDSNGNGQIDYAEDIGLGVTLNNLGENPATGVSAVISTTDPYITLIQDTADYNTISGGGSGTNVTDFELTIAEDCPDGHIAFFEMAITSNEDNWDLSFTLILNAPVIEFYSIFIDDGDDNILDPGETADIYVSFQNDGGADANNAIGEISESDPYVTLNSTTYNFGTFNSGSIMTAVYNVSVAGTAPIGHVAEISAEINADLNYINFTEFVLQIGFANINEGFESGDFENLEWEMSGSADWVISTDAIEGMYCAKSGTISHNQNSDLSVTLDIIENGEISFYRKVSSESNYDYLEFYINGVLQNEWAGTVGWGQVIFPVQQGTVTFRWSYDKDGSVSTGSDCAWIDDIIFPAGGGSANMGFVEGNVALNGGTGNVEDVNITAGSNLTYPDLNGDYIFPLPAGIYDVIASLDGYETVTENNVQVVANVTTTVDFELTYLEIPVNLSATVVSNDVTLEWEMPETSDISRQTPEPRRTALMTDRIRQRNLEANENIDSVTRSLTGFKVYRNGAEIAEITNPGTMTYYDEFLNAGNYSYYVTAVYDDMNESLPSNTEEITITLAPPTQLSASSQPPDIVLDWVAPDEGRNLTGYRVYRDEVEIAEVTIVTYTDENVPTGNYTYYVTAVYGNYESEPSNEVILEHNVDQEIIVIEILPIPGDVTINETENIDFHFSGYDPDGNPLEFSWELDGVEVSTDSTYTFETDYTSAGEYTVSLEVTDNFVPRRISGSDSRNILNYAWDVTVNDVDQAIVVNSINPDPGPVIIQEGSIINFSIDAYDPDGNPLDYNWRLDGVEVSITSTYDFITNIGSAGVYLVTLDVTDNYVDSGESRSDLYFEWNVTVLEEDQLIVVNDIQPPPGSITINETEFIEFYIDAYDPDGFPLDYYWEVDGNLVSTDSSYTFTTDYTSAGIYLIELEVTDNFGTENTIYFDWSVTVIDVDQPIVVNELIPPEGDITIDEGDVINFSINAYDPDGNDLEYSWQIDGVVVSTDSTYIFETGYTSAGEYTVTLEVTDNFGTRRISGSVSRNTLNYSWDVTVNDVDQPIVVNELIPPEGNIVIDEGDVINFSIDAYDPDGNELEYLWSVYSMAVSDSSSYDFITNENSAGEYEITLFVTDNFGTRDELNFLWNVTVNNVVGSDVVFIPVITKLYQNHPNPFNPVTSIKFDIKENETGVLSIFNLKGQIIESQRFNSGIHTYPWNADKRGSGIYFYRLHTESYSVVKKMLLLK